MNNRKAIVDHYKGGPKGGWFVYIPNPYNNDGYGDLYVDKNGEVYPNALGRYYDTKEDAEQVAARYNGDSFESYWNSNVESIKEGFRNAFNAGRTMGS